MSSKVEPNDQTKIDSKSTEQDSSGKPDYDELLQRLKSLEKRADYRDKQSEIKIRTVDTDSNGTQIVLERKEQTWYSPQYLAKVLAGVDGYEVRKQDGGDQ